LDAVQESTDTPAPRSGYVGRQRLITYLRSILEQAIDGKFQSVMLHGEPGMGKTRTATEATYIGESLGFSVFWGRSHDSIGSPPLWPWIQILRAIASSRPEQIIEELDPTDIALLVRIIPELRNQSNYDPGALSSVHDTPAETLKLYDAGRRFLTATSKASPILILLDDMQWTDQSTVDLMRFLVDEATPARIAMIGCYRSTDVSPDHVVADAIRKMQRHDHFTLLPVDPLSDSDMSSLLASISSQKIGTSQLEGLVASAEGNPFFGIQLLATDRLVPGQLMSDSGVELPLAIRNTVSARLDRLSEDCRRVVEIASIVGRDFEVNVIARVIPAEGVIRVMELLGEASIAGFIETTPVPGDYRFTHDLIRETILNEMDSSELIRLNGDVAIALEDEYQGRTDEFAARIVAHHLRALPIGGPAPVVKYSLLAGWHALHSTTFNEAIRHFEVALAHKKGQEALDAFDQGTAFTDVGMLKRLRVAENSDLELAEILHGLMRTCAAVDRSFDAIAFMKGAFDCYVNTGEVDLAIKVAEYPLARALGSRVGVEVTAQALELVEPNTLRHAGLLSRYGHHQLFAEGRVDIQIARSSHLQAAEIARREEDSLLEAWAISRYMQTEFMAARPDAGASVHDQALVAAERSGDLEVLINTLSWAALCFAASGQLEIGRRHAKRAVGYAEKLGHAFRLRQAHSVNYELALLAGDWESVRNSATLPLGEKDVTSPIPRIEPEIHMLLANVEQGECEFTDGLAELPSENLIIEGRYAAQMGSILRLLDCVATYATDPDTLVIRNREVFADESGYKELPILYLFNAFARGIRVNRNDDIREVSTAYELLIGFSDESSSSFSHIGSVNRLLGKLAARLGNSSVATTHFQAAINWFRDGQFGPELAWTCYEYAKYLIDRPGRPNLAVISDLLTEAESVCIELKMSPLGEHVSTLRSRVKSRSGDATGYPASLSNREVEVLRLMAGGKSNRDIADSLFISLNTVSRHVTHILQKTDSLNRAEAAAFAVRHGLN
jgi:DNA-binding CsgD family transcriptional regulator